MSLTKFNGATNNIRGLADKPTQSALQLKTLFDKTGDDLKTYINETLTTELDTELGNKANSNNVYTKTEADASYKLKGDFAVMTVDNGGVFNYPEGFNYQNCVLISAMANDTTGYVSGEYNNAEFLGNATTYEDLRPSVRVEMLRSQLCIVPGTSKASKFKIVLMKIS